MFIFFNYNFLRIFFEVNEMKFKKKNEQKTSQNWKFVYKKIFLIFIYIIYKKKYFHYSSFKY